MSEKKKYMEVVLGLGTDKTFTYSIPDELLKRAAPGHRVVVPLGKGVRTGFIVGITGIKGDYKVKDVIEIPDEEPLVPPCIMELTRWVAAYYRAPWGLALGMALPPGLEEGKVARPRTSVEEESAGGYVGAERVVPNPAQTEAVDKVLRAATSGKFGVFLLHGATGSGKTEVYLRIIEGLQGSGRGAVVLAPEIALTPQLVKRFRARFGAGVAVLHSGLTDSQRRAEWRRIRAGKATVVVGARSAVFAPFVNLGIIIVDEEHDGSYKQEDGARYHARDVAVMRAKMAGCPVVLGSATPSLESYYNTSKGKYNLIELPERATGNPLPPVTLIDLKDYPGGMQLTPPLMDAAKERLGRGEQALFFLNRRGYSDFLLCRDCGHVPQCPNCSISLTYHRGDGDLLCHWCGVAQKPGPVCPKCGGHAIKYMGGGTERLERELAGLVEGVNITRMDKDTVKGRGAYSRLLDEVASGSSAILLGTQMVAKGHDLPGIGLVGVVMADYGLHLPDFRAAERVFQVVTQVAGRSGRGDIPGVVMVQTYQPEHYSLKYAKEHDYKGFYEEEIKYRGELGYPPFSRLVLLTVKAIKPERAEEGAKAAGREFRRASKGTGVEVLGPAPAAVKRVRGKYRFSILLKSTSATRLHDVLDKGLKSLNDNKALPACSIDVDVDPQNMV